MSDSNESKFEGESQIPFKPQSLAFAQAIEEGRLSEDPKAKNYVGHYMYMGPGAGKLTGKDAFKHIITRQYDV